MPVGTYHGASGGRQMCGGGKEFPPIPYRNVTNIKKNNLC